MSVDTTDKSDALAAVHYLVVKAAIFVGIPIVASVIAVIVMLA